ncbi:MAG: FMN-binding protein [Verrucomicrobiales bacterium]|nr:FMN-binding protein [Verrucomicrobiales bacterium]
MRSASVNSCEIAGARLSGCRPFACLAALFFALLSGQLEAKVYLTRAQAQKVCFPEATRFEQKLVRFSSAQMSNIRKASGVEVKIPGVRCMLAWRGETLEGAVIFDYVLGKSEVIDYCVALTPKGDVKQIEVLQYRESHGYEIRRDGWRRQFVGKTTVSKLRLHDDIANITGATISCRNVTSGVKRVLHTWRLVLRPALVAASRLPDNSK